MTCIPAGTQSQGHQLTQNNQGGMFSVSPGWRRLGARNTEAIAAKRRELESQEVQQTWAVFQHGGPNHLKLWSCGLSSNMMALITSRSVVGHFQTPATTVCAVCAVLYPPQQSQNNPPIGQNPR